MIRACPACGKKNRVPATHLTDVGRCGACKAALPPPSAPIEVGARDFDEIVAGARVPVLIDFWASWCGPCRRENPNVVQAYEKYSKAKFKDGKGFTVFSVSLDKSAEAWAKAIEQDKLAWDTHVSDLQFWNSKAAQLYGVRSIPMSFLVDPKGVIVAKNLRGLSLHQELDKYVKSF